MRRSQSVSQTEQPACARWFSLASIFKKTKVVIFLFVAIVSMIAPLTAAPLASAQQSAFETKTASNPSGFPLKSPLGWDQKQWDSIRESCNHIARKARAHQPLDKAERGGSGTCMSVSIELMNAHSTPAPGAYQSP
jgi:hypothetical protein